MKVLHFYKTYLPDTVGGVEQVINQIARSTERLGVNTEVLSLSPTVVERIVKVDGHLVHRCRSNFELASTPISVSAFLRFRQLAKHADVIHFHFPYPFADVLDLFSGINKPKVVTYHSDIVKQETLLKLYRPLKQRFLKGCDSIVATSPNYLSSSKVLSRFKDKVSVIPIGLDKESYPEPSEETLSTWREQLPSKFFLFLGVLRYYKGLHILIEAAAKAKYPVVIVGSGPIEAELKAQADSLKLDNIYFLGFVSEEDKVALLKLSYAVVFPSHLRSEAFGISLLEGAMYGKPLISSEIGTGTTFINIHEETGLVVPPSDAGALCGVMQRLWLNEGEAVAMGARAEKRFCDNFTADKMGNAYFDVYENLLDRKL